LLSDLAGNQLITALVDHISLEIVYVEVAIFVCAGFFNQALLKSILVWEFALQNSI
jgi:hypothetical protein